MSSIKKLISFTIIILFLTSPILTATSLIKTNELKTKEQNYDTSSIETDANYSKISQILELITEEKIEEFMVDLLKIGPRYTGTEGCNRAADFIAKKYTLFGLENRFHYWTALGPSYKKGIYRSQNVEATLPGTDLDNDEVIVFNAHYDTVRLTEGANDDGSGTVAVIAAAYVLSQFDFKRTIKFVNMAGEEIALLGSTAYAEEQYKKGTNIFMDINADMIGYAITKEGGRNMGISFTEDALWVLNLFKNISSEFNLDFNFRYGGITRWGRGWSDYYPFTNFGIEAVACWGSSDRDPNMHQPTDTIENVNFSYLTNTTKHIVGTIALLADMDDPHPQIKITNPPRGHFIFKDLVQPIDLKYNKTIVMKDVWISTEINKAITPIERVEFYFNDKCVKTDYEAPFNWRLDLNKIGKQEVKVVAYDEKGRICEDEILFSYWNFLLHK